jgi:alginate O-acetyltransferase complex protein AlgI
MDYVYIPLGGNRCKYIRHLFNLLITFLVSGIWHGANWTFFLWGLWHGVFIILDNVFRKKIYQPKWSTWYSKLISICLCFAIACFGWIFFRANNVNDLTMILSKIFTEHGSLFNSPNVMLYGSISLLILIFKDIKDEYHLPFNFMHSKNIIVRYISMSCLIAYVILFGGLNGGQFIYFQF